MVSIVCLRLSNGASNPRLTLPESAESANIFTTNTVFSSRAVLSGGSLPTGEFSCTSTEGHTTATVVANGETHVRCMHASLSDGFP